MNKEQYRHLYFIKLLQEAFESETPKTALKDAIGKIKSMSTSEEFKVGYENFVSFIHVMEKELSIDAEIRDSAEYWFNLQKGIAILLDDFDGPKGERQTVLDYFKGDIDFEELKNEIETYIEKQAPLLIEIIRDDQTINTFDPGSSKDIFVTRGISPGDYSIRLSNGRLLWHSRLNENSLLWSEAFPNKEYPAAAMTEPLTAESSISTEICDNSFILKVIPGLEAGTIIISPVSRGR